MLKKIGEKLEFEEHQILRFSNIERYQTGTGLCLVYNAVLKKTKNGKPFVTLYLRDVEGAVIPGYIFDLASPLLAGGEAAKVIGQIVDVEWTENYLDHVGMTVILSDVALATNVPADVVARFSGTILDLDQKEEALYKFFKDNLHMNVSFPVHIKTHASPDYMQGRVGGLLEYYYRMSQVLQSTSFLADETGSNLVATFAVYLCVHAAYVRANDSGSTDITLVTTLTSLVSKLASALNLGPAAMEIVHMFFGYKPMDVYVRNIAAIADLVQRMDKEFELYKTIPLQQEGDAGYGKIKRYKLEEGAR